MKIRIGLIGLGNNWNNRHQPALRALSDRFEIRVVCDPVAHRAEQVAKAFNARTSASFREVALASDVDAILLLSARWFGSLPVVAACEAGKAVYCAASLDLNSNEADQLRKMVREAGIAFMAEFPFRLAPATLRLQELMATRLGRPQLLFCNQRHTATTKIDATSPHAVNMRQTIEMVDWCRYLVGCEPTSVIGTAHAQPSDIQTEDYLLLMLDFPPTGEQLCGAQAQIACGSYVKPAWSEATAFRRPADLQVVCERGVAFVDLPASLVWFDSAGQHTESLDSERPVGEQLLMMFHRQVESLVLKTASLEDAYRAMSIVIAAQQSHLEGRRMPCG